MKFKMNVYLEGYEKEIQREIEVNDNLSLELFSEYLITIMNGKVKHLYMLSLNDKDYVPKREMLADEVYLMKDKTIKDLYLKENDILELYYDDNAAWKFIIEVVKIEESENKKDFLVLSGIGKGIIEDLDVFYDLRQFSNPNLEETRKKYYERTIPGFKEYILDKFDVSNCNKLVDEYLVKYTNKDKPKKYIMNVSLDGFTKEIKRKIVVNGNTDLETFAECIILSMKGDLDHLYAIKMGKEFLDDEVMEYQDLNFLDLIEKQKFKVIYDFGDNWIFNITVSKIEDGHNDKFFQVIKGKGYGIVEDCGGVWNLEDVFDGTSEYYEQYDIEEFDLDEINNIIDSEFN